MNVLEGKLQEAVQKNTLYEQHIAQMEQDNDANKAAANKKELDALQAETLKLHAQKRQLEAEKADCNRKVLALQAEVDALKAENRKLQAPTTKVEEAEQEDHTALIKEELNRMNQEEEEEEEEETKSTLLTSNTADDLIKLIDHWQAEVRDSFEVQQELVADMEAELEQATRANEFYWDTFMHAERMAEECREREQQQQEEGENEKEEEEREGEPNQDLQQQGQTKNFFSMFTWLLDY
eukprot:TRINITY_DN65873_c7_g3_i1.p1 TRINITY_DN65873_c7_g3~~TRINITY_DN65873_c7_g3_i1.p1  ORF type:complete len:238 (+),score=71.58 TRINITY_DN65873_c7_g3_i1:427-1140(+)